MAVSNLEKPNKPEVARDPKAYLNDFSFVSGADPDTTRKVLALFDDLPALPADSFEAAKSIRHFLIQENFTYDDNVFCLQAIVKKKKGNCLGLSLLIGALLYNRGHEVSYQIITHPKDAIDKQDQRLFEELMRGDHFDYDSPQLAKLSDVPLSPTYRFAPLEHPSLVLNEKHFETTSLEDLEEDPGWMPEAELVQPVTFSELSGIVYIDRAKMLLKSNKDIDLNSLKELVLNALRQFPDYREGWYFLWQIAAEFNDEKLKHQAFEKYASFNGQDSRFYQNMYEMTKEQAYLDKSLEKYPANVTAFALRHVVLENDQKEAKFNLAVASWCVANSSAIDLKKFYLMYENEMKKLYGKEEWKRIFT